MRLLPALAAACLLAACKERPGSTGAKVAIPASRLDMDDEPFGGYITDGPRSEIDGRFWKLSTRHKFENVETFYWRALPDVKAEEVNDEGDGGPFVRWRWTPPELKKDFEENVSVTVWKQPKGGRTQLRIRQETIRINR